MVYMESIYVYCENHIKRINALCGKSEDFLDVKAGGT
jgi:hypothetical protein